MAWSQMLEKEGEGCQWPSRSWSEQGGKTEVFQKARGDYKWEKYERLEP